MTISTMLYIIALTISSMAFIFIFTLIKKNEVTKEKLEKILGDSVIEELKNSKNEEEMKEIIRKLPKSKRSKLKTLLESQDIRDAINAIKIHILDDRD